VFLGYASPSGQALIDRALYLPQSWTGDPERRTAAGGPETITLATKPKLGRALLERAFAAGVPCAWVVGDSVDGADHALRRCIEQHGRGYVLTVTSAQRLGLKPVKDWLEDVPARGWRRLSAGDGAKGPRLYDWAYLPYRAPTAPGWQKGLLIRRKIKKPTEFTFYLTLAPTGTPLAERVRVAGTRWTVESCFETAKGEVGLDQYEVRSWTGWHRHITLALFAHAYPAALRKAAGGEKSGWETEIDLALRLDLLPPTVPELRRLLWHLVWAHPPDPEHILAWSAWRRRHQQRARRSHWKRRTRPHKVRL
jgi:SRSO17 transposase